MYIARKMVLASGGSAVCGLSASELVSMTEEITKDNEESETVY